MNKNRNLLFLKSFVIISIMTLQSLIAFNIVESNNKYYSLATSFVLVSSMLVEKSIRLNSKINKHNEAIQNSATAFDTVVPEFTHGPNFQDFQELHVEYKPEYTSVTPNLPPYV
jgi:uncharacterized transporter YbjL